MEAINVVKKVSNSGVYFPNTPLVIFLRPRVS
jgi:hypothetical protein